MTLSVCLIYSDFLFAVPSWRHQKFNLDNHVSWFVKVKFWQVKYFNFCTSSDTQKGKKKSPGSTTIASRRQSRTPRGERRKGIQAKQTNAQKAHRPAHSSPIEVMAILKGLRNTRTKHLARANSEDTDQILQNVKDNSLEMSVFLNL